MNQDSKSNLIPSPFGGMAKRIQSKAIASICEMYQEKCGIDVMDCFASVETEEIYLYECEKTGYKFWNPESVSGNEDFYKEISRSWPNYYRTSRWEHKHALRQLRGCTSILEIGCGPGHFLKKLENHHTHALGLELNRNSITDKVTRFPIQQKSIEDLAKEKLKFDAIYAFQVLEHVSDPHSFIHASLSCLSKNGMLMFSVPNNNNKRFANQEDAFDLPPHHVGHFNPEAFIKIGEIFDLDVKHIYTQRRAYAPPDVTKKTRKSPLYKIASFSARKIIEFTFFVLQEPGENLLVVYRKNNI